MCIKCKNLHLHACIEPRPSIDCCLQSATLVVFQLHVGMLLREAVNHMYWHTPMMINIVKWVCRIVLYVATASLQVPERQAWLYT